MNTENAQRALDLYASRPGSCSGGDHTRHDDYQCDLVDLIADLLHLADTLGTDHGLLGFGGEGAAESALSHYRAEVDEGTTSIEVSLHELGILDREL